MSVDSVAGTPSAADEPLNTMSIVDATMSVVDDVIGSVVNGRYRVTGLIGRGGMASVYRAQDLELPREVALKLMPSGSASLEEMLRQRNEIATLASLNHPALVTLFDAGTEKFRTEKISTEKLPAAERTFLVMELVDGPNLRQLLAQSLPHDQIAHIAADIAEALHYMHDKGIVHRDIKPANILLARSVLPDRKFRAKLADLGIAKLIDSEHLTSAGIIVGSANYLSPEQARGDDVGPASDVYSLGLVLLEALTGHKAFPGTGMETVSARLAAQPAVPTSLGGGWVKLLTAMTALDPDLRPLPLEVARATEELLRANPTAGTAEPVATEVLTEAAVPPSPTAPRPPSVPQRLGRMARRRATLIAAAGIVSVAAAAGVISWTTTAQQQAGPTVSYPTVSGSLGLHLKELQRNVVP
jgi:eukaryotic-like serine/threonine-protein kinase